MRRWATPVLAAVSCLVTLGAFSTFAAAADEASTPPPSPASLLLKASDLSGKATVIRRRTDETSAAVQFGPGLRLGSTRLLSVRSEVALEATAIDAGREFDQGVRDFSKRANRELVVRLAGKALFGEPKSTPKSKSSIVSAAGPLTSAGAGATQFVGTVRSNGSTFRLGIGLVRVDRAGAFVFVVGLVNGRLASSDMRRLVALARERMRSAFMLDVTRPPLVMGVPLVGQVVHADEGNWVGGPSEFAYAWARCDATGANCAAIPGATDGRYTIDIADRGSTLRVTVEGRNSVSARSGTSETTDVVVD